MGVSVELPKGMKELIELPSSREKVDEKTLVRELIREGLKDRVVELYAKGEISLSLAAEALGVSVYEVMEMALRKGYSLGPGETESSIKYVKRTLGRR